MIQLPGDVSQVVGLLSSTQPPPAEIWLMGSRANGRATPASDWDFVVFGSPEYLKAAQKLSLPSDPKADILVVTDGNNWVGLDATKRGKLKTWKWRKSANQATYQGTKFEKDEESSRQFGADMGNVIVRKEHAFKVWPP